MGLISSSESDGDDDPIVTKKKTTMAAIDSQALAAGLVPETNDHLRGNVSESDYKLKQHDQDNKRTLHKTQAHFVPKRVVQTLSKMAKISDELDQVSNTESIDSDRFRSINQIFSQIKNDPNTTFTNLKQNKNQQM